MKNTIIAPSVLAADFANLQRDIEMINNSQADWFHIDIMDGVFVPNISFGMPVLEAITKHAKKTIDVHLMIVDPDRYIKTFKDLGADIISEASRLIRESIHYGLDHRKEALAYALQYGRDLDTGLADKFVGMYVNDWTVDYGEKGRKAVQLLLTEGHKAGVIPHPVLVEFV